MADQKKTTARRTKRLPSPAASLVAWVAAGGAVRLRKYSVKFALDKYHRHYRETANPVFAWLGYREAREAGCAIPTWVLDYLDRPASHFWDWTMQGAPPRALGELPDAVAHALGMRRPGRKGRGNVFDTALSPAAAKAHDLVSGVYARLRADKRDGAAKITQAIADEAKASGVESSTVERAWNANLGDTRAMMQELGLPAPESLYVARRRTAKRSPRRGSA